MIAHLIGYPIAHPTLTRSGYPNRPRIARIGPFRIGPYRPVSKEVVVAVHHIVTAVTRGRRVGVVKK